MAFRRSRVQWSLLIVVMVVAVLSATLIASLVLLADATEKFSARTALANADTSQILVQHRIDVRTEAELVVDASEAATQQLFDSVPWQRNLKVQSGTLAFNHGEDNSLALGYASSLDNRDSIMQLLHGSWPSEQEADIVEATVPNQLLEVTGLKVGDTFSIAPFNDSKSAVTLRIVGAFTIPEPDSGAWSLDNYQGLGYNPVAVVPFTQGMFTTDGFGPIVVDYANIARLDPSTVVAEYVPDYSRVSIEEAQGVLARQGEHRTVLMKAVGEEGTNVRVNTQTANTLGSTFGSLAVTRSSVLVFSLLVFVLTIAALGQTSRLMAERRHGEQHLMTARGGANRQLLRLALIEAVFLGAIVSVAATFLAREVYLRVTAQDIFANAGLHHDPGLPPLTWVASALVGVALIATLCLPLLKKTGTFVDSEQARSRPGKRAAFQRSGLDLGALAIAALAYWQLRNYDSPVVTGNGVAKVDPLLAAGPAIALLAGSLVAVRLIPLGSRLLEKLAAVSKRTVLPLASWEVGRRSARAVSAILLLTLAVAVGSFSLSFLQTWKLSQQDQAQFQHPADVSVQAEVTSPFLTNATLDPANQATSIAGVSSFTAGIARTNSPDVPQTTDMPFREVSLLALSSDALPAYERGRLADEGGRGIAQNIRPVEKTLGTDPIPLPAGATGIQAKLLVDQESMPSDALESAYVSLSAIVQADDQAELVLVPMGKALALRDSTTVMRGELPEYGDAELSLVGWSFTWEAVAMPGGGAGLGQAVTYDLIISEFSASELIQAVPVSGVAPIVERTPIDVPSDNRWPVQVRGAGLVSMVPEGGQFAYKTVVTPLMMLNVGSSLVATYESIAEPIPAAITYEYQAATRTQVGDYLWIQVGDTIVPAQVKSMVVYLPNAVPRQETVIVNKDDLDLALVRYGGTTTPTTSWSIEVPVDQRDAFVAALPSDARANTQESVAQHLLENPLRVATQAALWLVIGGAVALAAIGFAVHAIVTVRAREIEFAQLRAVGVQRRQLTRIISVESVLLASLGIIFGVGIGVALGYMVGPLVAVGADGRPPIPDVLVSIPWDSIGLLVAGMLAVLIISILLVSLMLRRINPAAMLRMGEER